MKKIIFLISLFISLIVNANTYYVATPADGGSNSNPGTFASPFATWQYAIAHMTNGGDTVFIRGGVYYVTGADPWIEISPPNNNGENGTASERSFFGAYQPDFDAGDYPILDCSGAWSITSTNYSAIGLDFANYWHIKGITVRNMWQGGDAGRRPQGIGGTNSANIIFENCTTHDITARGFYFESGAWNVWDGANAPWPSDTTRWINCDSYNICDSANNSSGDAWKCGNYFGGVFIWEGCRAWNYADDGFDPSGAGKRIFNNCWAMSTNKYSGLGGIEGNGFKTAAVGAEQMGHYPLGYVFVEVSNCIAAYCMGYGFYNNLELGDDNYAHYYNNTSYHNSGGFFDLPLGATVTWRGIVHRNNLAYDNTDAIYEQAGIYNPSVYTESNNTWVATQETGAGSWPGWEYNTNLTVTDADFVSLDSSQIRGARKADWSLPDITFLTLATGSDLIDAGVDVGLSYNGDAPDIGYAEYGTYTASDATDILIFTFIEQTSSATINTTNHTVTIEVEYGSNVASLTPTISLSYGATISPLSGVARDFSNPVSYTVTAEDAVTQQVWNVTVTIDQGNGGGDTIVSDTTRKRLAFGNKSIRWNGKRVVYYETMPTLPSPPQQSQVIIADHTVVDLYDDIPQQWIDSVKKMWVSIAGESHSGAYRVGAQLLENQDAAYAVSIVDAGTPQAYTTSNLRLSRATWGDHDNATGWIYDYGEEDFWTNATALSRTKASLLYCDQNGPELSAFGFGWCWDATWQNAIGGSYDPVYYTRYAGSSVDGPDGNLRWGIDDADEALTGNSVSMLTYIRAMHEYIDYCVSNGIETKMIWTTGPVDNDSDMAIGESGYQQYLKYEYLRNHIDSLEQAYFLDFADILSYNDSGIQATTTWTDNNSQLQTFPIIHSDNMVTWDNSYHFGSAGALRIGKALWWLLARMAGWDGVIP